MSLATVDQDLVPDEDSVVQLSKQRLVNTIFEGVEEYAYWLQFGPCRVQSIIWFGHLRRTFVLAL